MTIRRLNLFGGPNSGKSTLSAFIYAQLKAKDYNIELIREYCKKWAYLNLKIQGFDQLYLLAQQIRQEELALRNGVDYVITDSPVMLAICYCQHYGLKGWEGLKLIENDFEEHYPSLNIVLKRDKNKPYNNFGRFQSFEDAITVDNLIQTTLQNSNREFVEFPSHESQQVLDYITQRLNQ